MPGLHDAHAHFTGLGASMQSIDLRGTTSYEQVVSAVRQRAAAARPGEWIVGRGWDQNDWPDKQWPTHDLLSAASPDNPVYLTRVDGHAGLVNRRAMDLAGLSAATTDPAGGRLIRGSGNQPSGVLIDTAQGLVSSKIPPVSTAQLEEQILLADRETRRLGLTMVHDAGTDGRTVEAYKRLIDAGRLKTRLYVMLRGPLPTLQPAFDNGPIVDYGNHHLAVRAIKVVADGALGSRGAAMLEPYSDEPGTTGLLTTPPDEVYAQTLAASKAGFQTAIHAIGDRANRAGDGCLRARAARGAWRSRASHAQRARADPGPRRDSALRQSQRHCVDAADACDIRHAVGAGPDRARADGGGRLRLAEVDRVRSDDRERIRFSGRAAESHARVLRRDHASGSQRTSGNRLDAWERMSRDEALASFTRNAAFAAHAETLIGSLESGKLADFVVLSKDIMRVAAPEILTTTVRMTIVGGEIVYNCDALSRLTAAGLSALSLGGSDAGRHSR